MDRYFQLAFPVAPFLIAPNIRLGTEAAPVFAPLALTLDRGAPRSLLYDPTRDGYVRNPVIGQVWRRKSAVIATTIVRSAALDPTSGRPGQELIIGIRAEPIAFSSRGWV